MKYKEIFQTANLNERAGQVKFLFEKFLSVYHTK